MFGVIFLIGIFANLDKSMIGFTADKLISTYGFTKAQMGNLSSVFYVSFILVTIPGGWLVDRFGYKKFVVISLAVLMVFSLLFGTVSSLFAILLLRFMVGFGQAGYTNGAPKIISDSFEADQCAKIQSFVVATAGIGGILASTVGESIINTNWHHAYWFLGIGYMVALLLAVIFLKEHKKEMPAVQGSEAVEKEHIGFFDAWKNRNTLLLAGAVLFSNLVGVAMMFWLPNVFHVNFNIENPAMLSTVMVGFYVIMTIAMASSGIILTKYFKNKELSFIFWASVLTAVCLVIFITAPLYQLAIAALYIGDFAMMLAVPYQLIPRKIIGSAFAVLNIGAFLGGIISPQIVSAFAKSGSYVVSFLVLALCMVISGGLALLVKKPAQLRETEKKQGMQKQLKKAEA
ncbi:MFS transporter [[Clostridium] innocuum]|uniref:MFS transporter n=1 Tax=Clostridium innocuum TaxID=1522 RepID=A0A3E2VXQ6_CLOIN|nr:MFS transporter [[Clostridium] innocuum]RHV67741.1 MFS transporter [Clostridiaceae bacterium OM02-2AC]